MRLDEAFDANTVEDVENGPIPAGHYNVVVHDCQIKATSSGTGKYILMVYEVEGGDYDGRFIWQIYNLWNSNSKAVQIAKAEMKRACLAMDYPVVTDTDELLGRRLMVEVGIRPGSGGYGPSNQVRKYFKKGSNSSIMPAHGLNSPLIAENSPLISDEQKTIQEVRKELKKEDTPF